MNCAAPIASAPDGKGSLNPRINLWGLGGFLLAVLALLLASLVGVRWPTVSLSALGLFVVLGGSWAARSRGVAGGGVSLAVGAVVSAAVLLVAVFAPGVLNPVWTMNAPPVVTDPDEQVVVPRDAGREKGRPLAENEFVDAATEGIRQDDLFIRVDSVKAGRLPERGATSFLLVNFRIDQFQDNRATTYERFVSGKHVPSLTDDAGRAYAFLGDRVRKQASRFDVFLKVDDFLIFELPPSGVGLLKLELPAAAWGRKGVCRFRIADVVHESTTDMAKEIARTKSMLRTPSRVPPDVALGRTLFAKNCQECHTLYGIGGKVGPDLTASKRGDLDFLLTSIIDPSAVIEKAFQPTLVTTTKGVVHNGIIKNADADAVYVTVSNKIVVVPRSEIEEMKESKVSLMPTELLKEFDEHQVRSLIAYLSGTTQTAMLATLENAPYFFFYAQDLSNWYGDGGWKMDGPAVVAPGPRDGKPAALISRLHLKDDFHMTLRFRPGEKGRGAVVLSDARRPEIGSGPRVEFTAGEPLRLVGLAGGRVEGQDGNDEGNEVVADSWNKLEITVADNRIRVRLNDRDAVVTTEAKLPERGVIVLEGPGVAGLELQYRGLDLRVLAEPKDDKATK